MSTIHDFDGKTLVYTKGAPRNILDLCTQIYVDGEIQPLTKEKEEMIEMRLHEFANEGLRVIAMAYKELPKDDYKKGLDVENNLIFVGLAAMRDPPRIEVNDAVQKAQQAGIKTVIITGDYGPTAEVCSYEVGIVDREGATSYPRR
jgi:magnesium-transporting ATPase (P-type)